MILSPETIAILDHFADINNSIVIDAGNLIKTRNEAVYGEATVPETFPFTVSISDLKDFLQAIARFREPLLTFGPDHVLITESDQTAELSYLYAKPGSISLLPMKRRDNQAIPAENIQFRITEAQWADIQKSLGVGDKGSLEHRRLGIACDGTNVSTTIIPSLPGTLTTEYSVSVIGAAHGSVCNMIFSSEHLPTMPGDYDVIVTPSYTQFIRIGGYGLFYFSASDPNDSVWGGQTISMFCWIDRKRKYREALTSATELNKAAVFDALATSHITSIIADFDGYGDSGQIDDLQPYAGESEVELPDMLIRVRAVERNKSSVSVCEVTLKDAVEQLCYDYLEQEHPGWEINDGSSGEFCFDVESRTIALEFNGRFTDTWTDNHTL